MDPKSTILYVDDNPKARRLLSAVLEQSGYRIVSAATPSEAIALVNSAQFDLALLDYGLPSMSGTQLAQKLKECDPSVPVVLISGVKWMPGTELTYVDAYCGSGSTLDELVGTIEMLLVAQGSKFGWPRSVHLDAD
jgi:DNA-binding NtrC family response regulator